MSETQNPAQKIEAAARDMVSAEQTGWPAASIILRDNYGWTGGAIRIAAVQCSQLADHYRQSDAENLRRAFNLSPNSYDI